MLNYERKTIGDAGYPVSASRSDKSSLAAFGGTRSVPKGSVTPWPATQDAHLKALEQVVASGRYHRVNHPIVRSLEAIQR